MANSIVFIVKILSLNVQVFHFMLFYVKESLLHPRNDVVEQKNNHERLVYKSDEVDEVR